MAPAGRGSDRPVWTFTGLLAGCAGLLGVAVVDLPPAHAVDADAVVLVGIAALFAAAHAGTVWVPFRREAHAWSMSEVPLVLGLAFLAPASLLAAQLAGRALAFVLVQRQRPLKWAFNLSLWSLEVAVAIVVHRLLLGDAGLTGWRGVAALVGAVGVASAIGAVAVPLVIRLRDREAGRKALGWVLLASAIAVSSNTSLGVLGVLVLVHEPAGVPLLVVVGAALLSAYRAYGERRQQHENLQRLYALTALPAAESRAQAIGRILIGARELLHAEQATLYLSDAPAGTPAAATADEDGVEWWTPDAQVTVGLRTALEAGETRGLVLPRAKHSHDLAGLQVRDALAVDLGSLGTLVVCDRLGEVRSFGPADLQLLETFANHMAATVRNGELIERLREQAVERLHEAMHDALTGLPSRRHFLQELQRCLDELEPAGGVTHAVMIIDLDHFKEINDTLGHQAGDALLRLVAAALRAAACKGDMVARLGGDEFAVLARDVDGVLDAVDNAARLRHALMGPFDVDGLRLGVDGSVGIGLAPRHGADAVTLLRAADVAMYAAKRMKSGVECYASERDDHSPRRLTLLSSLRSAIDGDELSVHYQPKMELLTGEMRAIEALVRWRHPVYGDIAPSEFVTMAEYAGLMQPLTSFVLRAAVAQIEDWRSRGLAWEVAVNLSTWNLLDVGLIEEVDGLLHAKGLDAGALRLEITESSVMADPYRTARTLDGLRQLGVGLSLDDFGTGYSSLAWLKKLPIDEVKLDRAFTRNLNEERGNEAIVRATVQVGRALGLRVLAEGVEDRATLERLDALGCDAVQGYFLSHPLDAEACGGWLRRHHDESRGVATSASASSQSVFARRHSSSPSSSSPDERRPGGRITHVDLQRD